MLSKIGIIFIILASVISIFIIFNSIKELKNKNEPISRAIYNFALLQSTFSILSFFTLVSAFIISDFSIINVFENSHTEKPLFYKIAGTWGNHEGSLLLWINILVIFSYLFLVYSKNPNNKHYRLFTLIFQNLLILGFLIFLLINSNPFTQIYPVPLEGKGLNPILQDPALAIHPPLLYIGFVGSSIYFSAAMASIITSYKGKLFAESIKPWIIITWSFQTLGIILGSIWAYYELGWGGFWFWDPVENISLMPWFVITALMHSIIVLEKRNTLYGWVIILCLFTFILSVTGTFLVRSGILNSVHTFANDPSRGLYILIFLSLMIFSSLIVFFQNYKKEEYNFEPKSKETFILVNNWFMVFFLVSVLIGTLYPIFLEIIANSKISVGPPYYNLIIIPFVCPLLLFMAIGPQFNWIKNKRKIIKDSLFILMFAIFLNILIFFNFGKYSILSNIIFISSIFLIYYSVSDCLKCIKRKKIIDFSRIISHLGFGLLVFFIGLNYNFSVEHDFNLKVGEIKKIDNHEINFKFINTKQNQNYQAIVGTFIIKNMKNKSIDSLNPEIRIYSHPETLTYEASIKTSVSHDLYLTMSNISRSDFFNIKFQNKPFMIWIWISSFLIASGGFIRIFKIK